MEQDSTEGAPLYVWLLTVFLIVIFGLVIMFTIGGMDDVFDAFA